MNQTEQQLFRDVEQLQAQVQVLGLLLTFCLIVLIIAFFVVLNAIRDYHIEGHK